MAGKRIKKTFKTKPLLRLRIRCAEEHEDPWLRRLYVLWALAPKSEKAGESESEGEAGNEDPGNKKKEEVSKNKPQFFIGQTNVEGKTRTHKGRTSGGYLSPLADELDPELTKSIPQVPGIEYWFYFVRHPGADLPSKILKEINNNFEAAKEIWGNPHALKPEIQEVGKKKTKELILKIPEKPESFIPRGSDFYGGWVLFRDMPGSGRNDDEPHSQCSVLNQQVKRLQHQLGRLRYLVGNSGHPYMPAPLLKGAKFKNEGFFDVITWNSVMAWQRDASAGKAMKLDPTKSRAPTLSVTTFDPLLTLSTANYRRAKHEEVKESDGYVTSTPAPANEGTVEGADTYLSVIDKTSGDGIKQWLENELRKPGRILVGFIECGGWDMWIADDIKPTLVALDAWLKNLGANGLGINHTYRNARIGVEKASGGSVSMSIHKTGYAIDLAMRKFVVPRGGNNSLKLYHAQDPRSTYPKGRMHWIVWAKCENAKVLDVPTDEAKRRGLLHITLSNDFKNVEEKFKNIEEIAPLIEYTNSVNHWIYDGAHEYGGSPKRVAEPGHCFLNLTRLISPPSPFALKPIRAHQEGWQARLGQFPPTTIQINGPAKLKRVIDRLGKHMPKDKNDQGEMIKIAGCIYPSGGLKEFQKFLKAWVKWLFKYGPCPSVYVEPRTKDGQKIMRILRKKTFRGKKVLIEATQDAIAPECKADPSEQMSSAIKGLVKVEELVLSKKSPFPKFNFFVTPVTDPSLNEGDEWSFPVIKGMPGHMEWWHHQWLTGYGGHMWANLVKATGWTDEGLGWCHKGKKGVPVTYEPPGPYGQTGLGYPAKKKGRKAY